MIALVFFGVATSTGRGHIGVDLFLRFLPDAIRPYVVHASRWILFLVSVGLVISSYDLVQAARLQTAETGLPQTIYVIPVLIGSVVMMVAALEHALRERAKIVLLSGAGILALAALGYLKLADGRSSQRGCPDSC
jgi:TRAP-type C4-dicarboxylate transport system permease small subunit